jgi:hypothetical protein
VRGGLAGFGDLLQHLACPFRRCSLGDISLRNNATTAPALIDNRHAPNLDLFQQAAAILDARLGLDGHRRTRHGVAHSRLPRILARRHDAANNVAIGDDTDGLRVVFALDHGNLAAVVLYHHLRRFLHPVLRHAAGRISRHYVFCLFHVIYSFELRLFLVDSNRVSHLELLRRVT